VKNIDAVLGSTGFVGSNLLRQREFARRFDSSNIDRVADEIFGTVVCAAAPGSMFEANRFPDRDTARIEALILSLSRIRTRRFVLISTIAVLAEFAGQNDEGSSAFQAKLAYGRNRRRLEAFCSEHFEQCLIVRLPALFGEGLKKNFLFDLLNPVPSMLPQARFDALCRASQANLRGELEGLYRLDAALGMRVLDRASLNVSRLRSAHESSVKALGYSAVQFTNAESRFQFYDMTRLWADIEVSLAAEVELIHLAPEPVAAGEVHAELTGTLMPATSAQLHREDMHTRHARLWGRPAPYILAAATVMARLREFYAAQTAMTPA